MLTNKKENANIKSPNEQQKGGICTMAKNKALCNAIKNHYKSEAECARALGWPRQRLNKITSGIKEPDVHEVNELAVGLQKSVGEVCEFFLQ